MAISRGLSADSQWQPAKSADMIEAKIGATAFLGKPKLHGIVAFGAGESHSAFIELTRVFQAEHFIHANT